MNILKIWLRKLRREQIKMTDKELSLLQKISQILFEHINLELYRKNF